MTDNYRKNYPLRQFGDKIKNLKREIGKRTGKN
jgi:hypothetical protein